MPNTITAQTDWESLLKEFREANFLQSWQWREFHQALGKHVDCVSIEGDDFHTMALVVRETAKRGRYLAVAGGPLCKGNLPKALKVITEEFKSLAKAHQALFVRVRPQLYDAQEIRNRFSSLGYRLSPMHLTADLTLQLDLRKREDELLKAMRKTTRYEIRKGDSLGFSVEFSTNPEDIKEFHQHQLVLASKHGFVPFSYQFLHTQFEVFAHAGKAWLAKVHHQGKLLAAAFIIFSGREAVYHYGISTPDNAKLPGSAWLQWQVIKAMKEKGAESYNFWGVAPQDAPKDHRFAGVSLFKRGFGGEEVAYLPAHDLPVSPLYTLVAGFEALRAKQRHLA